VYFHKRSYGEGKGLKQFSTLAIACHDPLHWSFIFFTVGPACISAGSHKISLAVKTEHGSPNYASDSRTSAGHARASG